MREVVVYNAIMLTEERIFSRVTRIANGCWEWQGMVSDRGYALMKIGGKEVKVHQVAYRLFIGEIPAGLELHHRCENKRCVNPEHLDLLSRLEHLEMHPNNVTLLNRAKTHCEHGHAFTPGNTILRRNGGRDCRECNRQRQIKFRAKKTGQPAAGAMGPEQKGGHEDTDADRGGNGGGGVSPGERVSGTVDRDQAGLEADQCERRARFGRLKAVIENKGVKVELKIPELVV